MAKLTIRQAVINVADAMTPGETLLGYEFYNRVLRELMLAGNKNRPLDGTVLRALRDVRDICGIESKHSVSEYRKKSTQLNEVERSVGQTVMF